MSYELYASRRREFAKKLGEDAVALIPSGSAAKSGRYAVYAFRQDSNFYYLTGWEEPDAILVIIGGKNSRSILYCQQKIKEQEIWTGERIGADVATRIYGFDEAYEIANTLGLYAKLKVLTDQFPIVAVPPKLAPPVTGVAKPAATAPKLSPAVTIPTPALTAAACLKPLTVQYSASS